MTLIYTDWFEDWHEPVQIVQGGHNADYHHASWQRQDGNYINTPLFLSSTSVARVRFGHSFDGPYPGLEGGVECGWRAVRRGFTDSQDWPGFCPTITTPADEFDSDPSSGWALSNDPIEGGIGGGLQYTEADAYCAGFSFTLNNIYDAWTNQFFAAPGNSDGIESVSVAFDDITAAHPGWGVEFESSEPVFSGVEFAADEVPSSSFSRSGASVWVLNASGWAMDDGETWTAGTPAGVELVRYGGGTADWVSVPDAWLPTQNPSSGELSGAPDVTVMLYHDTIWEQMDTPALVEPGDPPAEGGRDQQTLAFRTTWRVPRVRFYRERSGGLNPRRVIGKDSPARVYPLGLTQGSAARVIGGAL